MKGLLLLITFVSFNICAESVSFKVNALSGEIHSYGIKPEQAQVVLRCQFIKNGNPTPHSEIRPLTRLEIVSESGDHIVSKITSKSGVVRDFLPGFKLHNCSFNLMILARNLETQKVMLGDFFQMGQLTGQMSSEELKAITNSVYVTEDIQRSWNPLTLRLENTHVGQEIVIE